VSRETWPYSASKERIGRDCVTTLGRPPFSSFQQRVGRNSYSCFLIFLTINGHVKCPSLRIFLAIHPEICRQCIDADKRVFTGFRSVLLKFRNPNFLEPCGPLQASNGTALPLQRVVESSFLAEEEATQRTALFWAVTQRLVVIFFYRRLTCWILDP